MKRVIIDTDPGNGVPGSDVDDALAIAVALLAPDVEVLGVTTVAGNVELADANRCALHLLESAGRSDVPVCAGAAAPLLADPTAIRTAIAARRTSDLVQELWSHVPAPFPRTGTLNPRKAAAFIAETVMAYPGEVTLIAIGPLTNVATALLLEPDLARNVARIVLMGGAVRVPGSVTPATELNACYDPEATHRVFASGAPITMVSLDVTTRTILTLEQVAAIRAVGTPLNTYLANVAEPWVRYVTQLRQLPGCWLHDPLAVCVAIDPTIVRAEPMYVGVELESHRFRGQTVGWSQRAAYLFPERTPNADVCLEIDNRAFMNLFLGLLGVPVEQR